MLDIKNYFVMKEKLKADKFVEEFYGRVAHNEELAERAYIEDIFESNYYASLPVAIDVEWYISGETERDIIYFSYETINKYLNDDLGWINFAKIDFDKLTKIQAEEHKAKIEAEEKAKKEAEELARQARYKQFLKLQEEFGE